MLNISFHIYDVENEALFSYDSILAEAILDLIIVCPILVPIHSQGITYTDRFYDTALIIEFNICAKVKLFKSVKVIEVIRVGMELKVYLLYNL